MDYSGLMDFNGFLWLSHHIGNVIIPTDKLIFFIGVGIPPTSPWECHSSQTIINSQPRVRNTSYTPLVINHQPLPWLFAFSWLYPYYTLSIPMLVGDISAPRSDYPCDGCFTIYHVNVSCSWISYHGKILRYSVIFIDIQYPAINMNEQDNKHGYSHARAMNLFIDIHVSSPARAGLHPRSQCGRLGGPPLWTCDKNESGAHFWDPHGFKSDGHPLIHYNNIWGFPEMLPP